MAVLPVLLLCVAGVLSAPYLPEFNNGDVIAKDLDCQEGRSGLQRNGMSTFIYEGGTENTIVGSSTASTGMKISARVHIQPTKDCMYTMQISEAKLMMKSKNSLDFVQADESKKFSRELEAQELLFSVKEGKIQELYPSTHEKTHVLNLKRGILSTLQLGDPKRDLEQTDVNGICKVKFTEHDGMITKTKDLSECRERIHSELGVQASTFQQSNLPINPLNSTSTCLYKLTEDKTIAHASCDEVHILRPFSAGFKSPSGAITKVWQRLQLEHVKRGSVLRGNAQGIREPSSLLFKYEHEEMKPDSSIVDRVDRIMNNLVDQRNKMNLGAKQNYAHEFTRLVSLFRQLDRKRMMPIWTKYFDCTQSRVCGPRDDDLKDVYRQYLLDALTYCGTSTCVYVVHNVIIDEAVTGEKVNMFLQGVALVAKPTKAMIRDILEIADKRPSRQAYLTLGTLLLRFCSANKEECAYGKTNPVTQAEVFLEGKLGQECEGQENMDRVEELLRAIKAIGNAGRPVHIWNTLARCARMSLHQNVSIAALDAMRRLPCDKDRMDDLYSMLGNVEMDPERRIHVFLAIMKCPSRQNLERVVEQLNKEPSRQLGSFMWSHLTNLNESSDLSQSEIRTALRDVLRSKTLRKFDLDRTKYSRSWEGSLHSRMLKSGVKAEGHLIFHPESYLPRSALLNLTAHVMGVPLNMLEMAIRVEGLETVIEDVFGPHGMMPDSGILKLFNITITKDDLEQLRESRDKRDVSASMEENIANLHSRVNKRRIHPSGSLSVKMFGHDVRLMSYDDIFWMIDQIDNMNVIELLLKLAKGGHKTFTKSVMFLEMTQTVPVGLGLPLKLKLTGSAVGSVELDGKFDIRNMFWGPSQMELKGFVKPSAVAEISGQMGIESHFIRSGMFINASMFTSQVLKGGVLYKEGSIVKVNLDAPEEPVEIFNVSTTPFLYFNEDLSLVEGISRRVSPELCLNATMTLGLGVCTSFAAPVAFREYESPYFPLSGPAHFGVKLVKADAKLTTYELKMKYDKQQVGRNGKEYLGTFQLGTPGALYSRGVSGMVKLVESPNGRTLTLGSMEGHRKFEFMAQYQNDTHRFEVEARSNMFTPKFVGTKFLFFNETMYKQKHIGALVSANYGDFKVQQMWKFVRSSAAYKLFSKTTYYPGKHLTGEVGFVPSSRTIFMRFDANQFNQSMDMIGSFVNTVTTKGLNFTAVHHSSGNNGTIFAGYVVNEDSKRIVLNASFIGKSAELEVGYFKYQDGYEVLAGAQVGGRRIEIFTNYSSYFVEGDKGTPLSEVLLGVRYSNQTMGLRLSRIDTSYGKMTDACIGTVYNHLEEIRTCISLERESYESGFYRRFAVLGKFYKHVGAIDFQVEKDAGYFAFNTSVDYIGKTLAQTSWQFDYNGLGDAQVSLSGHVLKRNMALRLYTEPKDDSGMVMGIEAKGFENTIAVTATYLAEQQDKGHLYKMILEAFYNEKLPASWEVELMYPGGMDFQLSSTFSLKRYNLKAIYSLQKDQEGKTSLIWDTSFNKDDQKLLGFKDAMVVVYSTNKKSLKQLWTITVFGKRFEYGWNLNYANLGQINNCHRQVKLGLQYARGKVLILTTDLFDNESKVGASVNFRFWHRSVTHSLFYNKHDRRLDVAVEFLPKMFVRFMMRLDRVEGWKLTSQVKFDWKKMNRVLESVARYVNNANMKELAFTYKAYGQELHLETSYNVKERLAVLTVSGFGKAFLLSAKHDPVGKSLSLKANVVTGETNTLLLELVGTCNGKEIGFEVRRQETLFKVSTLLDRGAKIARLSIEGRGKSIINLKWVYKQETNLVIFTAKILGQDRVKVDGKVSKSQKSAFLYIDLLRKDWNIGFAGKYNTAQKSLTVTAEALKTIVGMTLRADLKELIVGANLFRQNKVCGWLAYYDPARKAAVFNVSLTPQVSFQTVAEIIGDHILKFTTQRKLGNDVVNETSFSYDLSMYESRLIFKWNTKTVDAVKNAIVPIIQDAVEKAKDSSTKLNKLVKEIIKSMEEVSLKGKTSSLELYKKIAEKLLALVRSANTTYQNTDFNAHREQLLVQAADVSKQLSHHAATMYGLARTFVKEQSVAVRENMPVYLEKAKKLQRDLQKDLKVILDLALKIGNNLTESARPIVITAIKLAKEFKIRGRTMEELVNAITKVAIERFNYVVLIVKKETSERIPAGLAAIRGTVVPYAEVTVEEVYNKAELAVRKATFDYDAKRTIVFVKNELEALQRMVQKHLDEYLTLAKVKAMELPELVKSKMGKSLELYEEYSTVLEQLLQESREFLKPVVSLARNVNASIYKHYGPIAEKFNRKVSGRAMVIYKLYRKRMLPYVARIDAIVKMVKSDVLPYVSSVVQMTRDIEGQVANLKILEKKLVELSSVYMEALLDKVAFVPNELDKLNRTILAYIDAARDKYYSISEATSDEIMDMAYELLGMIAHETITRVKQGYKIREEVMEDVLAKSREHYQKALEMYKTLQKSDVEAMLQDALLNAEELIENFSEKAKEVIATVSKIYIGKPILDTWTKDTLLEYVSQFGVSGKIASLALKLKDSNMTDIILQSGTKIRDFALVMYSKAAKRACAHSQLANAVVTYFRSVPRKSFEKFSAEVDEFFIIGSKNILSTLVKRYNMFHDAAVKLGEQMVSLYDDYYVVYVVPAVDTYEMLKTKSIYVYEENKGEAEYVWNYYRSMASRSLGKRYVKARQLVAKEFDALYKKMHQIIQEYGDMTWEDLALKMYSKGVVVYTKARSDALQKRSEVKKYAEKIIVILKKEFEEKKEAAMRVMKEYRMKVSSELMPKVVAIYEKYIAILKDNLKRLQERSRMYYNSVLYRATVLYNDNKGKTLEHVVHEVANVASKKGVYLAGFVKSEVRNQYTRAAIVVKDILLPELKKEVESMFNQTIRASVVLANTTVDCFYPHYRIVVLEGEKLVQKAREAIPKVLKMTEEAVTRVIASIPKYRLQAKDIAMKYIARYQDDATKFLMQSLTPLSERFRELEPHLHRNYQVLDALFNAYVPPVKIEELKQAAKQHVESLQLEDKYNKVQALAKEAAEKIQANIKRRIDDCIKTINTAELRQAYENIKESMQFTMEQVKPKIQVMILDLVELAVQVPAAVKERAVFFRQFPEECAWRSYQDVVRVSRDAVETLRNENYGERYNEAKAAMLGFFFEVTDMRTKEALIDLVDKVQTSYAKMQMIPKAIMQKFIQLKQKGNDLKRKYTTSLQVVYSDINTEGQRKFDLLRASMDRAKSAVLDYWTFVKSEWNRCPFSPIFEHEVWGEIVDEVKSHELVEEVKVLGTELAALARSGKDNLVVTVALYTKSMTADLESVVEQVKAKRGAVKEAAVQYRSKLQKYYQMALERYEASVESCKEKVQLVKRFYKEKTIEEIVAVVDSLIQKMMGEIVSKKQVISAAVDMWVSDARLKVSEKIEIAAEIVQIYKEKAMTLSRVYQARAEQEFEKYRPVMIARYNDMTTCLKSYRSKAERSMNTVISKVMQEAKNLWEEHRVVERFNAFKRMKIGDTVEMIHNGVILAPARIQEFIDAYQKLAIAHAEVLKGKASVAVAPYLEMLAVVKGPMYWVGNEVNETLVFLYRFYGLKEKASRVKDAVVTETMTTAKMVPSIMKLKALQVKVATLRAVYDALVEADKVDLDEVKAMVKSYLAKLPKVDLKVEIPVEEIKMKVKSAFNTIDLDYKSADQLKTFAMKYAQDAQEAAWQYSEQAKTVATKYSDELTKRTRRYVEDAKRYVEDAQVTAKKYAEEAKALTQSYVDKARKLPSVEKAKELVARYRSYLQYVKFEPSEGRIVISIPHKIAVQPSFSYHVNKVSDIIEKTVDKTRESVMRLVQDFERKTEEFRQDLAASYDIHKELAVQSWEVMRNYGGMVLSNGRKAFNTSMDKVCATIREDIKPAILDAYAFAREGYENLRQVGSLEEAMEKILTYVDAVIRHTRRTGRKSVRRLGKKASKVLKELEKSYETVVEQLAPYKALLQAAVVDMLEGKQIKDAVKDLQRHVLKVYKSTVRTGRWKVKEFVHANPKILKIIEEYKRVHATILEKHLVKLRRVLKLAKVGLDRTVRIVKKHAIERSRRPVASPLKKTAMIFGRSHVMTFDKKFYEIPEYNKKGCTYLLARDFHRGNFTILSQREKIIVITPDVVVSINENHDSWVTINGHTTHVKGFPVQSPTSTCIKDGAFIKCSFKQGLDLTCDTQHFDCLIELSGWHYGKTEGLLGTNNNEVFDDWKMPGGALADNVNEFVDSWEISGDAECQKSLTETQTTKCNRLPSSKCSDVFGMDSPLAKYYSIVDPSPFQRSCQIDTADCRITDVTFAHCNSTASYVNLLRSEGVLATYLPECAFFSDGKRTVSKGAHWVQSPKKAVDVVVLMSERRSTSSMRKTIANMMYSLNKKLVKGGYKTSYALVGFGGDLVHERPHIHTTHDARVFMDGYMVSSLIKDMPYSGEDINTNDVAGAIQFATTLPFRPEASRIFVVFNGHKQIANIDGATIDEAEYALQYEANASLFMFDHYSFKNIAKTRVIGQSSRRLYMGPVYRELPVVSDEFPAGLFSTAAYKSQGALFSSKIKMRTMKAFASGLADSVLFTLKGASQLCKSCYLFWGNVGQGIPICRTNNRMTC